MGGNDPRSSWWWGSGGPFCSSSALGPTPLLTSRFEFLLMSRSIAFVAAGQSKVKQGTEQRRCERSDAGGKSDPSWEYVGNADCQRCSACQGSLGQGGMCTAGPLTLCLRALSSWQPPRPSPPPLWQGLLEKQKERSQIQSLIPTPCKTQTWGIPFLFSGLMCKAPGCSPFSCTLQSCTASQRQEFSQEIPLSSPRLLLLQGSEKLTLEIRSPFKFRRLRDLEFGFTNYLHLVPIKKLSNADVLISASARKGCTEFALGCLTTTGLSLFPGLP